MKIIIKTRNLELTEALEVYVNKKIGSLEKFTKTLQKEETGKTLSEVFVEIEKETKHHRHGEVFCAEAQIMVPGKSLLAKATGEDLLKLIVEVKEKLELEIKKYKAKHKEQKIRKARKTAVDISQEI